MRINVAAPQSARALAYTCATPAAVLGADFWAQRVRVRVTAPTTGMGHVGTKHIAFATGTVPGSLTWSPPI